jgi:hypothetical protein
VVDLLCNVLRLHLTQQTAVSTTVLLPFPLVLQAKELAAQVADLFHSVLRWHTTSNRASPVCALLFIESGQGVGSTGGRPVPQRAAPATHFMH